MSENKFKKYILYAIGEIILVIIGILIALQLNNWSSNSKKRSTEIMYLKQIEKTLRFDYENEIIPYKESREREIKYFQLFKQALINYPDTVSKDSLESLRKWWIPWNFHINTSAFEELRSVGSDLISNDTLRFEISNYYGYEIYWALQHNKQNHEWNDKYIYPIYFKDLKDLKDGISDSGYKLFKSDPYINNLIDTEYSFFMVGAIWRLDSLISKTEKLLSDLKAEIERLEN